MTKELQKQKTELNGVKKEIQDGGGYKKYREEIKKTEEQLKKLHEGKKHEAKKMKDKKPVEPATI